MRYSLQQLDSLIDLLVEAVLRELDENCPEKNEPRHEGSRGAQLRTESNGDSTEIRRLRRVGRR